METKFESKIGQINNSAERVYTFLSNFNNLKDIVPPNDKIKDFSVTDESCSFTVEGFGKTGLRIIEKEPNTLLKLKSENSPYELFMWLQFKEVAPYDTRVKITVKIDLNPMLKMMVQKPLQKFVDELADKLSILPY
jgi:carbon monoxide dehydrogenase subunit G